MPTRRRSHPMTETTAKTLTRVFKLGAATVLQDIDPSWPPERVLEAYTPNYPYLQNAQLTEPVVEGDRLVYSVVKAAVQTKGNREADAALVRIEGWAQEAVAAPESCQHWMPVLRHLDARLRDRATQAL